jgi:hypothetical protein
MSRKAPVGRLAEVDDVGGDQGGGVGCQVADYLRYLGWCGHVDQDGAGGDGVTAGLCDPAGVGDGWVDHVGRHNARCHEVFFDQSKNNSRTWFDTAACANALNLRAYRERRKAARFSDLSERDPG